MRTIISLLILLMPGVALAQAMEDMTSTYWRVDGLIERRASSTPDTAWQGLAWYGGDTNKIRLESSGVLGDDGRIDNEGGTEGIDSRLFYSRMIAPFWDAKAGVQLSVFDRGVTREALLAGVQGLAPYGIDLDLVVGVNELGILSGRLEARYDVLLSQKLIAQPFVNATVASADDPATDLGSGLAKLEAGLRLRYEIEKEFAPFIGVGLEQFTGATANFVAASGQPTSIVRALVGLKFWF
jgi:copper resistance protein B